MGDQQEFLELVNINSTSQSLADYYLVFYNGDVNPPKAYDVIGLSGYCVDGYGTLVLGRTGVTPTRDINVSNIQDARDPYTDAVALYYNPVPGSYVVDMVPTRNGLLDMVVYTRNAISASNNYFYPSLVDSINTYKREDEDVLPGDESITRCSLSDDFTSFPIMTPSPGVVSPCLKTIIEDVYVPIHYCAGATQPPTLTSTSTTMPTSTSTSPLPPTAESPAQCNNYGEPWGNVFEFLNGMQSNGSAVIKLRARSKVECAILCTQNDVCDVVNFYRNKADENCFLFSNDTGATAEVECDVGKKKIC